MAVSGHYQLAAPSYRSQYRGYYSAGASVDEEKRLICAVQSFILSSRLSYDPLCLKQIICSRYLGYIPVSCHESPVVKAVFLEYSPPLVPRHMEGNEVSFCVLLQKSLNVFSQFVFLILVYTYRWLFVKIISISRVKYVFYFLRWFPVILLAITATASEQINPGIISYIPVSVKNISQSISAAAPDITPATAP